MSPAAADFTASLADLFADGMAPATITRDPLADVEPETRHAVTTLSPREARAWREIARNEQIPPDGAWDYWLIMSGRGWGKALDCSTMIPTPRGWRKLGELAVGDEVFDESGRPCRITATYDPPVTEAYRFTFSDGTTLDACADHQWVTWTHAERKAFLRSTHDDDRSTFPAEWPSWRHPTSGAGPQVRTSREIVDTLTYGSRGDTNHCVPTTSPIQLPVADLPVDPWLLGMWLGDGTTGIASLSAHADDTPHIVAELHRAGYRPTVHDARTCQRIAVHGGLRPALRRLAVLDDKHVPDAYLWASIEQREALLRGLMDADGYVGANGQVEFCSMNRALADAVVQLATSLGQKPVLFEGRATYNGVDHGTKYRVKWRPTRQPFALERKAALVKPNGAQSLRNHHRMIVSAESIEPTAMRCLTVDGPHHMYLAGEGMIPTHNTFTGSNTLAEWACSRRGDYAVIAPTFGDARKICVESDSGLLRALGDDLDNYNKSDFILYLKNGSRIILASADAPDRIRGYNLSGVWLDEVGSFKDTTVWYEGLAFATRIGDPKYVITTTPRRGNIILTDLIKQFKRGGGDDSIGGHGGPIHLTRGSTFDNQANLARSFVKRMQRDFAGTTLGAQELEGELLADVPGALLDSETLTRTRVRGIEVPELRRISVGVDPATSTRQGTDQTGIITMGVGAPPEGWTPRPGLMMLADAPHLYLLADNTTPERATAETWARTALLAVEKWDADAVAVEVNQGGDMVRTVIQQLAAAEGLWCPPVHENYATKGKMLRAEPLQAMWQQDRVHVVGRLPQLEDKLTTWVPGEDPDSPDRIDASVWAAVDLVPSLATRGQATPLEVIVG